MVRIHVVIWRTDDALKDAEEEGLERAVENIVRTWSDELCDRILKHYGSAGYRLVDKYLSAFPAGYRDTNQPSRALQDICGLEKLGPDLKTEIDIHREDPRGGDKVRATLLQVDRPVTLSARVPIFENMGFDVISERTFELTPKLEGDAGLVYLHDTDLRLTNGGRAELFERRENLENGFLAIWSGAAANDRYNGLILGAGLDWRQAAVLRAYGAYYRQTGAPYGTYYVSEVLNKHARTAADLFKLFDRMFNPASSLDADTRDAECAKIAQRIVAALDKIPVLDEDRILRNLLTLINATLRTNFYQPGGDAHEPETIAFKLRSAAIDWLPAPKPFAEIFVYSPRFEGIHLRGGRIARGGIRWSDRPQDFRTEILSLAKAQQVKNVVIVPQGAKGGFVPRKLPASREASQGEGIACYKAFVSSLLSLTDNRVHGEIVPPERQSGAMETIPTSWWPPIRVRPLLRHRQRNRALPQFLARRRLCERRLGGLRPQEDGHHGKGRLGSGEAPFPRDEHRHSDNAVHGCGCRRHVRRRVRERHATVENDQARGRVRSPRHFHRPRSRPRRKLRGAAAPVRSAAFELAGLQPRHDFERRRRL